MVMRIDVCDKYWMCEVEGWTSLLGVVKVERS
jgi:hypothetical protein